MASRLATYCRFRCQYSALRRPSGVDRGVDPPGRHGRRGPGRLPSVWNGISTAPARRPCRRNPGATRRCEMTQPPPAPDPRPSAPEGRRDVSDTAFDVWSQMQDAGPLRSGAAILLGFAVLAVASMVAVRAFLGEPENVPEGVVPADYARAGVAVRVAASALGGWITAAAAPRARFVHAAVLAAVVAFMAVAGLVGQAAAVEAGASSGAATGFSRLVAVLGPVGVLAGGAICRKWPPRRRRRN